MSKSQAVENFLKAKREMNNYLSDAPAKELLLDLAKDALPTTKEGKILQCALVTVSSIYGALTGTTIIGGLLSGGISMASVLALINVAKNNNGEVGELTRRAFALASRVKQLEETGVNKEELQEKLEQLKELVKEVENAKEEPATN